LIVVDPNIVACLYLPGEHPARRRAPLERDPDWAVPLLWRSEFRNILAGYLSCSNSETITVKNRAGPGYWEASRQLPDAGMNRQEQKQ
jgi:hypothetical protein